MKIIIQCGACSYLGAILHFMSFEPEAMDDIWLEFHCPKCHHSKNISLKQWLHDILHDEGEA